MGALLHRPAGGFTPKTHCTGSAFARSPAGPFVATAHPFICQLAHRGSIDARVFVEANGQLVMLWKSEDNANPNVPGPDQGGDTGIYAQGLSANGRVLLGAPVKILSPSEPWESTIVEAPDMIEAQGTYWLFFSGNWFNSTNYRDRGGALPGVLSGRARIRSAPFLGSNFQGLGPGEESLFEDSSGATSSTTRSGTPTPVRSSPGRWRWLASASPRSARIWRRSDTSTRSHENGVVTGACRARSVLSRGDGPGW